MRIKHLCSKKGVMVLTVIVGLCFGISTNAAEFNADLSVTEDNKTESGKFYVKSNLVRTEKLEGPD